MVVEAARFVVVWLLSQGLSAAVLSVTTLVDFVCLASWTLDAVACIMRADRSEGEGRVGLVVVLEVVAFTTVSLSVVDDTVTELEREELVWVEWVGRVVGRWVEVRT